MVTTETPAGHEQRYGSSPHGGTLVNRQLEGDEAARAAKEAEGLPKRELNARELSDVLMIAIGGYSPLQGFMGQADYESVVEKMRLANGLPWSIPVTLSLSVEESRSSKPGGALCLTYEGEPLATLRVSEVFNRDKEHEAQQVYRTTDEAHPGVAALNRESDVVVGGEIAVFGQFPEPQ